MKTRYIVTYDIADPKRLHKVFKIMKGVGEHLQLSVFQCDLSDREREELISDLTRVIQATMDQVLLVDIGPTEGRAGSCIRALGLPYLVPERRAIVL